MEVSYILIVFLCCYNDLVWWDMENVPPPPYDLLECSHTLLWHILVFHRKENLGLFSVQMPIQVLTHGCLKGLYISIYIIVTKLGICLQHCYYISPSSNFKKLHLEYLISLMGRESPTNWRIGNFHLHVCLIVKRSMIVVCMLCS
jgi:hypothetical protein